MTPNTNRRNTWIAVAILASPFLWTVPTYFYLRAQTKSENAACEANLKRLSASFLAYTKQEKHFPNAENWLASLEIDPLRCPADSDGEHPSSYAMNAKLSGKKLEEIKNPSEVVLLYETTSKASTPAGSGEDLVAIGKDKAGQGRHNLIAYRFNYFMMADGTIRRAGTAAEMKPLRWTP